MNIERINKNILIIKKYNQYKNKISVNEYNNALQYLKTLNFNSYEDKVNFIYLLLDLLLNYKKNILFKELIIYTYHFDNIFNIFNLSNYENEYIKFNDYYNCVTLKYENLFNVKNSLIQEEIDKISNISKKYKSICFKIINYNQFNNKYSIYETFSEYNLTETYNIIINSFNNQLIISEPFIINDNNFEKYQEYFKSAIIFLINNEFFINELKNVFDYDITKNIEQNLVFLSDDYKNFIKLHINDIINEYTQDKKILINFLKTNNYIEIRNILNKYLNNKYSLCIPSFNLYPYYVIQDILLFLNNQFAFNCLIKYKYKYYDEYECYHSEKIFSCFVDCKDNYNIYYENFDVKKNCFLNDLIKKHSDIIFDFKYLDYNYLQTLPEEFEKEMSKYSDDARLLIENDECFSLPYYTNSKIFRRNFKTINNKYYYEKNIVSYIKYIDIYPKHLLINSSIDDINALFMYDNRKDLRFYSFNQLILLSNYIRHKYEINIIFPFKFNLKSHKYKLHSFIMIKNINDYNLKFINYKVEYNKELISLIRITNEKLTLNKYNIKNCNEELQEEFNTIYYKDCLKDCLQYKIIFCCYETF